MKVKFTPMKMRGRNNEQRWHWEIDESVRDWFDVPHRTETYERAVEALERVINEDKV